ncbi:protocatechuate 3,4-dioxygenase subunit alpha [Salinarimonas soli]|uniref:Protocatechuate 3,4-dioxygenase subunit alpha n=1 Tax=Salinarimonas soli TaxID=1638099 RepID=A0A5B2VA40_9HYPH|nr:protocatechuate 3,4-dioxygenase subunit alpha [Salinarimonas soli]KAA2235455.1 protocatechuate 3,4-dioxygenase subunit alpha [Salinarimonas soli]
MSSFRETPSQTAGPYVHIGLIPRQAGFAIYERELGNVLVSPTTRGERIRIEGRVLDGIGAPARDALVELWQANADGRYAHPADKQESKAQDLQFRGFGRAGTHFETGLFVFETIKPGPVAGRAGQPPMAPHVNLWLVARGINLGLATRMYFADEEAANARDPVLALVEPMRRPTLIARREDRAEGPAYVFDIRLQGEAETVFFDV